MLSLSFYCKLLNLRIAAKCAFTESMGQWNSGRVATVLQITEKPGKIKKVEMVRKFKKERGKSGSFLMGCPCTKVLPLLRLNLMISIFGKTLYQEVMEKNMQCKGDVRCPPRIAHYLFNFFVLY